MSFIALSVFFTAIGWMNPPEDIVKVMIGWVMIAWFGMSLAILLGSLSERSELIEKLWHPASYIAFPLSGAAFLVEALPKAAQEFVLWFPMVHGVEYVREGYFGQSIHAHHDLVYMGSVCLALSVMGLAVMRRISREVMPE